MTSQLLRHCHRLVTMDDDGTELNDADLLIEDGVIKEVGVGLDPAGVGVIDLSHHVVMPGLVNTHHHFFQTMTRAVPEAQDASLFDWLKTLYPIWARLTPEMIQVSTKTAMLELLLSGCTTTSDHLYLFPNGSRLDDQIEAASAIGMRFHATRGAMSVGESDGGLPPDRLVEDEASILKDCERLIVSFHDPKPFSMVRVALAPCSPFSVSTGLMRDAAALAREHGVGLHTHLAENSDDVAYSLARFGRTPAQYAEDLGWLGDDVWHAHCVKLDADGIARFAATGTGVAHCPCSNMRLGSGIAPVRAMLDAGVPVGLGVDGSASNDSGDLLSEARQAMLLQRVSGDPAAMSARDALKIATRGGAKLLGRPEIGRLEVGMAADIAAFRIDGLAQAGGLHDPLASLVFGQPPRADHVFVQGRHLVDRGLLARFEIQPHIAHHNRLAALLING